MAMTCTCTFGHAAPGDSTRQSGKMASLSFPFPTMKIVEVRHPLVQHKIGLMRNAALSTKDFRELANELGTLLAYEATADSGHRAAHPARLGRPGSVQRIAGAKITVVPILRAGLGMLSGVLSLIPACVSVVGLQRDEETLQPVPYSSA